MAMRDVVRTVLDGGVPPYVPWSFGFTAEAADKLVDHYGTSDLDEVLGNHHAWVGSGVGYFTDLGDDRVRDIFGVVWVRSADKDIGVVENCMLPEPTLDGYEFPDPLNPTVFKGMAEALQRQQHKFCVFGIGFSLFERAWTLRGMENLIADFYENPEFVHELLNAIADYNIAQVQKALEYDVDAIYFGDDWGQQRGLIMGPALWHEFIQRVLARMYAVVKASGRYVYIHSCGDVDELFDDLVGMGLDLFNPFQPEVMDVWSLVPQYRGRLAFHGGLSTQRTLPYGTPNQVRNETRRLIELGRQGGYILSPAHAVEGDVPLENMLAFIEETRAQPGAPC